MHTQTALNKPPLAALFPTRLQGRILSPGLLAERDSAIMTALADGHALAAVGLACGLAETTIRGIKNGRQRSHGHGRSIKPPSSPHTEHPAPKLGRVSFDGASAIARSVMEDEPNTCHWVIVDGWVERFCGVPATVGYRRGALTYCACHANKAFARRPANPALAHEAA